MIIIKLKELTSGDYQRIAARSSGVNPEILPKVRMIMETVKKQGDKFLIDEYQRRFPDADFKSLLVSKEEIRQAYKQVSRQFFKGIKQMIKNITLVHQAQLPGKTEREVNPEKGIAVWRVWRPIEKVGIYIPGGKAIYPSSVLMTAIPAAIAGCREIVMCSPARGNGQIPAATLVAADMAGLTKIFKTGGAEAIAAMTFGTETIPAVYKIFGAGNSLVTAAKLLALEKIAIDMPAGPSEIFIIADKEANPGFIAADLLADGEHGFDSACILLTTSRKVAEETIKEIKKQLLKLSTGKMAEASIRKFGLFAVVDSLEEAIDFTNSYAPEHLEIMVENPEKFSAIRAKFEVLQDGLQEALEQDPTNVELSEGAPLLDLSPDDYLMAQVDDRRRSQVQRWNRLIQKMQMRVKTAADFPEPEAMERGENREAA